MARSQGVAVPDRRLAQQPKRNKRRWRPVLMAYQPPQRHQARREQAGAQRQRTQIDVLNLLQREQRRRHEHREQDEPARVGAPSKPLHLRVGQPPGQRDRAQPDRQVDQKDRLPAELLGQIAAGDRSKCVGADRDRGEVTLVARPLARRECFSDQRLRQRHQPAAAQALQHAGQRQQLDAGRGRAQQRRDNENGERREHQPAAAERVAEPAVDRRRDRRCDQVRDDDP